MNYNFYLVDDDPSVLSILSKIIIGNNLGDVIGKSSDGEHAISEIVRLKPDILLVDLLLPKKDGIRVVQEVKGHYPEIPCIMISEVYSKDMVSKAYNSGIELFINKPINVIEVINVIKRVDEKLKMKRVIDSFQTAFQSMQSLKEAVPSAENLKNPKLVVNGQELKFDVNPIVIDNRVVVPLNEILEPLHLTSEIDENESLLTIHKSNRDLVLLIGWDYVNVNDEFFL
ncbi:response regulator [Fusibacter bizertensis]